jgi:hypothetical protein
LLRHLAGARRNCEHRGYAETVEQTARLTITRDHPQDIQDRPVYLWIDGEKWDRALKYGKTFERKLAPGHHVVKASNTLFRTTVEFDAAPARPSYRCENGRPAAAW